MPASDGSWDVGKGAGPEGPTPGCGYSVRVSTITSGSLASAPV